MADTRLFDGYAIAHRKTCTLHEDERRGVCSGILVKGGNCLNKVAVDPAPYPYKMPTCKIHRDQLRISNWCKEPLSCGFDCGRLFEWKPHEFQLCPSHRESSTTCFFLEIPTEIRLRIYEFLLPDRHIPARYRSSRELATSGEAVCTAILRVNRQTHDEASRFLYSTRVFIIELSGKYLNMCNSDRFRTTNFSNHKLHDYQISLMLLEQQNKRRLMMARQEQGIRNGESSSTNIPVSPSTVQLPNTPPFNVLPPSPTSRPTERTWHPPLSEKYFDMIRFFLIKFVLPSPRQNFSTIPMYGPRSAGTVDHKIFERTLYDACDTTHRLIQRLLPIQKSVARLDIVIQFCDTYIDEGDALFSVRLLLRPFRRINTVTKPEILSVTANDIQNRRMEIFTPPWIPRTGDGTLATYMKAWFRELFSSQQSRNYPQIFEAYWQLEGLLSGMKSHCCYSNPKLNQFDDLLHTARIAREADDLASFREVWDRVVKIWVEYLTNEMNFQSSVGRSIHSINELIGNELLGECPNGLEST